MSNIYTAKELKERIEANDHMSQFINSKRPVSIEKLVGMLSRCGIEVVIDLKEDQPNEK